VRTDDALKHVHTARLFGIFDATRDLIHAAAGTVYARGRKRSYDLVSADF
jgi:hypothetical protein